MCTCVTQNWVRHSVYRLFCVRCAAYYYTSTLSKKCYFNVYPIINRYLATSSLMFQDAHDTIRYQFLWTTFTLIPISAKTAPSYFLLIFVCRPGLQGHQISPLLTARWGTWKIWSTGNNHRQQKNSSGESWNPLTA